jgi:glycosyltransferase involved in cell wall biosynthesis
MRRRARLLTRASPGAQRRGPALDRPRAAPYGCAALPSVSVIIPTYNCAAFLDESLGSMLPQVPADGEVVVVDDGSTDDTPSVLGRYGERIRVVRIEHGGLAAARNAGLDAARGEWIAFHDADDVALPDRLAFQMDFVGRDPACDGVFANGLRVDEADRPLARGEPHVVSVELAEACANRPLTERDVFAGFPVFFQAALLRRSVCLRAGTLDSSLRIYPDLEYGYRVIGAGRILFVDRVVFRYRLHTTNITRDRLGGREELACILDRIVRHDPEMAARIGTRRLRARLARHYESIARQHWRRGDEARGDRAISRAVDLRPLDPRYRLARRLRRPAGAPDQTRS